MALFRVISTWPPSGKIFNGRISAKGHAIHFMSRFYGRVFRAPIIPYYIWDWKVVLSQR